MADNKGVSEEIGVAPEGPAGGDDIQTKPNPEGPDKVYKIPAETVLFEGFVQAVGGVAYVRIVRHNPSYEPTLEISVAGTVGGWQVAAIK